MWNQRNPVLEVSKRLQVVKGHRKKQSIFMVKLNPVNQENNSREPTWLSEYDDISPKELSTGGVDHEIELVPRAQPTAKLAYKMVLPKAIELKEQLRQLLE